MKEFTGVILYNHAIRAYYKSEYTGGHNPPDCGSMDGITGVGDPGGKCSDCKWSRWGTGKNGNGQACKERRRLYVLREGDAFPVLFTLPTASLDPWKYFARGLRNEHLSTKKVVTRFFLSKAVNKGGTDYSQAQFRMARLLSPDEATCRRLQSAADRPAYGGPCGEKGMSLSDALLPKLKSNLILTHGEDDDLLRGLILAALNYAEIFQKKSTGLYTVEPVTEGALRPTTEQAVIMLASHLYESRDGSTGGFFADSPGAARQSLETVDRLLTIDKDWVVS